MSSYSKINSSNLFAKQGGYISGIILPNSGHLRVKVSPDRVTVDYIRTYLSTDKGQNGELAHSYSIQKNGGE